MEFRQAADRFNAEHELASTACAAVRRHGGELRRVGHDLVGPCPLGCHGEGDDRFVVFGRPRAGGHGVAWCRRCRQLADALALSYVTDYGRMPRSGDLGRYLRERGYLSGSHQPRPRRSRPKPALLTDRLLTLLESLGEVSVPRAAAQLAVDEAKVISAAQQLIHASLVGFSCSAADGPVLKLIRRWRPVRH